MFGMIAILIVTQICSLRSSRIEMLLGQMASKVRTCLQCFERRVSELFLSLDLHVDRFHLQSTRGVVREMSLSLSASSA
ncbi:uncharacterized protein B0T23DRAFT_383872 [Neurospora hispaniola]|uniref:Secreted protein n=1 Tax=Neurospora hispaniola TaxID=588809 RepID=A0AAJ0I3A8_9PEZI|nr:hypothetical protein B0T23DRAFT_383872 [Neurospora hispaniola]